MCSNHKHITINSKVSVFQYDPTHTLSLRNQFAREMKRRMLEIIRAIRVTVDKNDAFGLRGNFNDIGVLQAIPAPTNAFAFPTNAAKMQAFKNWLNTQINRGILEAAIIPQLGTAIEEPWTNVYMYDSYKRGVIRARSELINAGFDVPTIAESGGIQAVMGTPFHIDRVGILYTRTFSDLKGITNQMDIDISRILSQGLVDGDNPRILANKLVSTINGVQAKELGITDAIGRRIPAAVRADMLARTEIIRAHAEATLQEYRNWKVAGVEVMAEFITAGDERVCPICESLIGRTYSIEEASGLIPVHPRCRCSWIPKRVR